MWGAREEKWPYSGLRSIVGEDEMSRSGWCLDCCVRTGLRRTYKQQKATPHVCLGFSRLQTIGNLSLGGKRFGRP